MGSERKVEKLRSLKPKELKRWDKIASRIIDLYNSKDYKTAMIWIDNALNTVELQDLLAIKGMCSIHILLNQKNRRIEKYEEALDYFIQAQKDTLYVLSFLAEINRKFIKDNIKNLIKKMLYQDSFFIETIEPLKEKKSSFEDIYIQSLMIISLLQVDREVEDMVAHYTNKGTCELLIVNNSSSGPSPFRINTVATANDPKEGKTLLEFLNLEDTSLNADYQSFVGSFIFNPESLNQFRLYGKENGQEATGVSIVIDRDFFSDELTINNKLSSKEDILKIKKHIEKPNEETLFRCIYIDPQVKKVISIGHKEEQVFYRVSEKDKKTIDEKLVLDYKNYINNIFEDVKKQLNDLKGNIHSYLEKIEDKDEKKKIIRTINELLIHLKYLVKHAAFKEEQECRIIKVEKLKDNDDIKIQAGNSRMYIDYGRLREKDNNICHIRHIYFGPKATGINLFKDIIKHEGLDIQCHQSDLPYS